MSRGGRARTVRAALATVTLALVLELGASTAATAAPQAPWWRLSSSSAPTHLRPGDKEDVVVAAVSNLGDANASGSKAAVTVTDHLPPGLTATAVKLLASTEHQEGTCEPLPALRCTFNKEVEPYVNLEMAITVEVSGSLPAEELQNTMEVQGGEAPSAAKSDALTVANLPTPFGAEAVELAPEAEGGVRESRAGSHPFQLTTVLDFNRTLQPGTIQPSAPALLKNLHFDLPPGMIGDPQATPHCSSLDFSTLNLQDTNSCPAETVVGVALVTLLEPVSVGYVTVAVPVFNLAPALGEPARLGFEAFNVPVVLDTAVRTGGDYSVQVNVSNATSAAQVLGSAITLWGEPGDPRHDSSRGWGCIVGGKEAPEGVPCDPPSPRPTTPFLRLPTSCEGPLRATLTGDSWSGDLLEGTASVPALGGCDELPFTPAIALSPEVHSASTPTGLSVSVKVPQEGLLGSGALAQADLRDATVALPEGVQLSPSSANGLQACSESQIGFTAFNAEKQIDEFTPGPASCPDAAKLGVVHIKDPLLPNELQGAVYLATPAPFGEEHQNPFNSLAAVYIVAEEPASRVLVKLAGEVTINESTLQVATTFRNSPQVPFEELKVDLFGGPRAAVTTPPACGGYQAAATFTPWSGQPPVSVSSAAGEFAVSSGPGGAPCPGAQQPFAPGFQAHATNTQAGAFTPFTVSINRADGDQAVRSTSVRLPPGVAALLSSVTPCPEPQAAQGACAAASLIGHTTVAAGLGPEPVTPPQGQVFITGPYKGAPFGLSIVAPAVAGPFDLGNVVVRATINIDPNTAAVTIDSDPLPTQLKGIPLQLQQINVAIDRPGFEFNPTNCNATSITGALAGAAGATEPVSAPFQVTGCQNLPFSPVLTASVAGHASKSNGTSFDVKLESQGVGQANIAKVDLQLPLALPSRLATLQKACGGSVFALNPAACSAESIIGTATIHTPVLKNALSGPAYLVSHGSAAFPDVEFVLQGEGITLILDGKTDIKAGITYSRFETAPDAPFTRFETVLPAGPHSALTAYVPKTPYDLCGTPLSMPAEITSQSGVTIKQKINVATTGCGGVKHARVTSAQLLAKALKACRARYKHNHARRAACERKAKKRYKAAAPRSKHKK